MSFMSVRESKLANSVFALEAERDAALADNAELVRQFSEWVNDVACWCTETENNGTDSQPIYETVRLQDEDCDVCKTKQMLASEHPGTSLLARLSALDAVVNAAKEMSEDFAWYDREAETIAKFKKALSALPSGGESS